MSQQHHRGPGPARPAAPGGAKAGKPGPAARPGKGADFDRGAAPGGNAAPGGDKAPGGNAGPTLEYGLIGGRLGHSYSPEIHRQLGSYRYELCPLPTEAEAREFLSRRAFKGINVTVPYKQLVIPYCDELDERARAIGAVNTVVDRGGRLYGYNTDFSGMEYMLKSRGIALAGRTVLILGMGGTCKTALAVARHQGAARLLVASRDPAARQGDVPEGAELVGYREAESLYGPQVEVILNTSPAGMYPKVGECLVDLDAFPKLRGVADAVYNPFKTELVLRAEERGIPAVSGFGMLVAQAVYAAGIFLDKSPDTAAIPRITGRLKKEIANLSLIGMPSCGKSSIGRQLAKRLGKKFVDLDAEIVRTAGVSIPEIFAAEGEAGFRRLEAEVTARFAKEHGQVLSCGGGVVKTPGNVRALRQNGPVLFIDRPLDRLAVGGGRPLSKSPEALAEMEAERRPLYLAGADAVVKNDGTFNAAVAAAMEAFYEALDP